MVEPDPTIQRLHKHAEKLRYRLAIDQAQDGVGNVRWAAWADPLRNGGAIFLTHASTKLEAAEAGFALIQRAVAFGDWPEQPN
jgi:hypothetical protein